MLQWRAVASGSPTLHHSSLTRIQHPAMFPARFSSTFYHHQKTGTLQSKLHSLFLMLHCQFLFPGLLLAVLSFLLTCHDRAVSIMFTFFPPYYWNFLFLLFSLMSSLTSWRPSSFLTPSPHHTCLEVFALVFLSCPSHCLSVLSPSCFLDFSIFFHFRID